MKNPKQSLYLNKKINKNIQCKTKCNAIEYVTCLINYQSFKKYQSTVQFFKIDSGEGKGSLVIKKSLGIRVYT